MKNNTKKPFHRLAFVLILAALWLTGCTEARETMMQMRQELRQEVALEPAENSPESGEKIQQNQPEIPSIEDIRIEETYEPVQTMGAPVQEITVALYFGDSSGENLVKQEKSIPKVEGMARATIETLLEGPDSNSGLTAVIPQGTQLLDINVKQEQKKCIVDFSHELGQALDGTADTANALESIARTLCQFDSIEEVEFRMEGQTIATLKKK